MSDTPTRSKAVAEVWLREPEEENHWAEAASAQITADRSDRNEIRVTVSLNGDEGTDAADIYLTNAEASRLAHLIGAAVLS